MGASLRSLTGSPFDAAVRLAHLAARRHLETGGAAAPAPGRAAADAADFVLPPDIAALDVAVAVKGRLRDIRGRHDNAPSAVKLGAAGRIVVPRDCVEHLGDGDLDRGRRVLDRIIADIRDRRILQRVRQHSAGVGVGR